MSFSKFSDGKKLDDKRIILRWISIGLCENVDSTCQVRDKEQRWNKTCNWLSGLWEKGIRQFSVTANRVSTVISTWLSPVMPSNLWLDFELYSLGKLLSVIALLPFVFLFRLYPIQIPQKRLSTLGEQIPERYFTQATQFRRVAPNICWASEWNIFHVTLLMSGIFIWLLNFGKIVHPCSIYKANISFLFLSLPVPVAARSKA